MFIESFFLGPYIIKFANTCTNTCTGNGNYVTF